MTTLFVPYYQDKPASIELKGHKILLVSTDSAKLEATLSQIGGDRIEPLELRGDETEQSLTLSNLALSIQGGVVLAPPGVEVSLILNNLERELPWMH